MAWTERYCSPSGGGAHDGTTAADAWTLAEAITNVAAGHRVNIIAGTYANTTTDRTFSTAGTTTAPIWWRGYNTAIGDIDTNNALTKPAITFTTGRIALTGTHQLFSNLDISSAQTANGLVRITAGMAHFDRCRIECTAANANGRAIFNDSAALVLTACYLKATTTATDVIAQSGNGLHISGCTVIGGTNGINISSSTLVCNLTTIRGVGTYGILSSTSSMVHLSNVTVRGSGSDGVRFSNVPTTAIHLIHSCLFASNGGWGINNSTGANTNFIRVSNCDFWNNTSGTINGFGDAPSLRQQTESSDPNTSGTDLSLVSGAAGKATGLPGAFENESYTSYLDIGGVQRQESSGGGTTLFIPIE
jgi:hypothetical protein